MTAYQPNPKFKALWWMLAAMICLGGVLYSTASHSLPGLVVTAILMLIILANLVKIID